MSTRRRGHHYTIEECGNALRISMPTPAFGVIVLAVLVEGGLCYAALWFALTGLPVYGAIIGILAILSFLVVFARNKEVVEVSSQSIAIWDDLGGIRLRSRRYLADHIRELRISAATGGLAAFDYGAATVAFGRGLGTAGAEEIVAEIKRRFPQYQQGHGDAHAQPEQPFNEPPGAIRGSSEGIEPPPPRYRFEVSGNMSRITIPSPNKWFTAIVVLAVLWLFFLLLLEAVGGPVGYAAICIAIYWALVGVWGIYNFLWQLVGKEEIELAPDSIAIRETVLGIGRPRVYASEDIRRMRVDPADENTSEGVIAFIRGTRMIAFDYQGKYTARMGFSLTEAEAKELVAEIQREYPHYK